jgi:4-hydroxy-tetrahydrodipicolinate reductase
MATRIAVFGAMGRMGQAILRCASEGTDFEIVGGVEYSGAPVCGQTVGQLIGRVEQKSPIVADPSLLETRGNCVTIHFSTPGATVDYVKWSADNGYPAVVGTTGLDAIQRQAISDATKYIPVVFAPNMSVGVNTLFHAIGIVARILDEDFDVEITEIHHRFKKDAPSGTARRLAEIVAEARGKTYDQCVVDGRSGLPGERPRGEIGMHALRGGDVVGEHTVSFVALGERVELTHRAHSRDTLARGSLRAAQWIEGRAPGMYDMQDVLGLR